MPSGRTMWSKVLAPKNAYAALFPTIPCGKDIVRADDTSLNEKESIFVTVLGTAINRSELQFAKFR